MARCCWSRADAKDATADPGGHRISSIYRMKTYDTKEASSSSSDSDADVPHPLSEKIERRRAKRSKADKSEGTQLPPVGMYPPVKRQDNDDNPDTESLCVTQDGAPSNKGQPYSLSGS